MVSEIMAEHDRILFATLKMTQQEAIKLMSENQIRHLPVLATRQATSGKCRRCLGRAGFIRASARGNTVRTGIPDQASGSCADPSALAFSFFFTVFGSTVSGQ